MQPRRTNRWTRTAIVRSQVDALTHGLARGKSGWLPDALAALQRIEALTPYFYELIKLSAQPLKSIESDFEVDSSGFSTGQFMRWLDVKYGTKEDRRMWLKLH